jgi:hypothetical protein
MKRWLRTLSALPLTLPLAFEPASEPGRFLSRHAGAQLEVSCDGLDIARAGGDPAVRLRFAGARAGVLAVASEPLPGRVHRLIGRDRARWQRDLPLHGRVTCPSLYPGLDLTLYGREGRLEFDVVAAPGADLSAFELTVEGAAATLEPSGDLALHAGGQRLTLRRPVAYQEAAGERRAVASRFVARGASFGFAVGAHDRSAPLVIDPVLELSSYAGGNRLDTARAVAIDAAGFVLVAGTTESKDFPTTGGSFQPGYAGGNGDFNRGDAFVLKLAPGGTSLVWATYLGGDDADAGEAIAVAPGGEPVVAGGAWSKDFPTTPDAFQPERAKNAYDAFVARLSADGSDLVYATFLGGNEGDFANAVAVDAAGNTTVAGYTYAKDFPVSAGAFQTTRRGRQDAFVSRFAPGGALLWSSYLGGGDFDFASGLALGADGGAVVVGGTDSKGFPTTEASFEPKYAGEHDAFVSKLSPDGTALVWSSFFGGKNGNPLAFDAASGVALDAYESVYVVGRTLSRDLPVTPSAFDTECGKNDSCTQTDAFAAKLSADGCALLYGSYLGEGDPDEARAVAVDALGRASLAGFTRGEKFPVTPDAFQSEKAGGADAFLTQLSPAASQLVYSTYFGSKNDDAGNGVALDGVLHTALVGSTSGNDLPIVGSAFQPLYGTDTDGFVAVFSGAAPSGPSLLAGLSLPPPAVANVSGPGVLSVRNPGSAAANAAAASLTLGPNLAFVSAAPSQGSCSFAAPVLSCALGTLAPGAEALIGFVVQPTVGGVVAASATATGDGAEPVTAGACVFAQVNDLAIRSLKTPKQVRIAAGESKAAKVRVEIENLGNHAEPIDDLDQLAELVTLEVTPTGPECPLPAVALDPKSGKKLPLELAPGKKLKVTFEVTIACTATDERAVARVHHEAIDGLPDSLPGNDVASALIEVEPR